MDTVLYEKPIRLEMVGFNLFVNGTQHPKSVRTLGQMKKTLMNFRDYTGNLDMYYMYRSIYKQNDMRFDITAIPALDIEGECAKTHGHYHPVSDDGLDYPEVYQVLVGNAVFILQKKLRSDSVDTLVVHAKAGEIVLLPPGFGHVSINNGNETLILSNLVYDKFESKYDEYDENKGAAYYYLKGGEIAQNTNYIIHNSEHLKASELNTRYGFECNDILNEFYVDPHKFAFLQRPKILFKA